MKKKISVFSSLVVIIVLISSFNVQIQYRTSNFNESNPQFSEEANEILEEDIGFEIEGIEYIDDPNIAYPQSNGGGDFNTDNDFDYDSYTMYHGNYRSCSGEGSTWSEDPDDGTIFKFTFGDNNPLVIGTIGDYFKMEAKVRFVSANEFPKQFNPSLGGEVSWKWDVNGHEIGNEANLYYSKGNLDITSGSGHYLDNYYAGGSLDINDNGDPAVRIGTTIIENFDSIIDSDGKIRFEARVYAKGFVNWWLIETKDVFVDLLLQGFSVRQDLIQLANYDNNMDYDSYKVYTGEYRGKSGHTSAWSEDPNDNNVLQVYFGDDSPTLGWYEYLYFMDARIKLVSHNTFTKQNDEYLGGAISWTWDVDGHEIGNQANLHKSSGKFKVTSGDEVTLDQYSMGSYSDKQDQGDPSTRSGTTIIQNFDSIIDGDGKIRFEIRVSAYGWVNWWVVEDKDVYFDIEVHGLSIKQNLNVYDFYDNNFYCNAYQIKEGNYRGFSQDSGWSREHFDGEECELKFGDNNPTLGWYEYLYKMEGRLFFTSYQKFDRQLDGRLGGQVAWTYDITGHETGNQANLYNSYGALYIIDRYGTWVTIDAFSKGSSTDYHEDGDPNKRTGSYRLSNFDRYIHYDGHLRFALKCIGKGWVNWWVVENKDVYVELDMEGLAVTQEIRKWTDLTPPVIAWNPYTGDYTDGNPGGWDFSVCDDESGINIDTLEVFIDDVLVGNTLIFYPCPNSLGKHTITVKVMNNHPFYPVKLEANQTVTIVDDDTKKPVVNLNYYGSNTDGYPGYFVWSISDQDDGIGGDHDIGLSNIEIKIDYTSTDGSSNQQFIIPATVSGKWWLPSNLGLYEITIIAKDNDNDRTFILDSLLTEITQTDSIYDDDTSPPIVLVDYKEGDGTDGNPGYLEWSAYDVYSGLSELFISASYSSTDGSSDYYEVITPVSTGIWELSPNLGYYELTIHAVDNDNDRGLVKDSLTTHYVFTQEIVDDDITPPLLSELEFTHDFEFVNISLQVIDESGIKGITVFVDEEEITPVSWDLIDNNMTIVLQNNWILKNDTYNVRIIVEDNDNDRLVDTSSSEIEGSFEISISDCYNYVIWQIENLKDYLDDQFHCIDKFYEYKLSKAQYHLDTALQYVLDKNAPLAIIHDEIAECYIVIAEIMTEFFDWFTFVSDEQANYIIHSLHEIRDNIVILKGLSLGSEFTYSLAFEVINLYHLNDYIEENINYCGMCSIRWDIFSVIEKLDFAFFVVAINHDPGYILSEVKWDLDQLIYDIYSLVVCEMITLEEAEILVNMIDVVYWNLDALM
ncbi:MAG: hypothetical protein ACTSQ0_06790 [Candidatus Heimdallarchaeota archaeon]